MDLDISLIFDYHALAVLGVGQCSVLGRRSNKRQGSREREREEKQEHT